MIKFFRNNQQSLVVRLLLGILVLSFVGWGVGDVIRNLGQDNTIVKVGREKISIFTLEETIRENVSRFEQQFQTKFTPEQIEQFGIPQMSLNQLVENEVMQQILEKYDIQIAPKQVLQVIHTAPEFQKNGTFDKDTYEAFVKRRPLQEQRLIASIEFELKKQILQNALFQNLPTPQLWLQAKYLFNEEERSLKFITYPLDFFQVEPADEAKLQEYYTLNVAKYITPEQRSFELILIDGEKLARNIIIEDATLKTIYEQNKAQYVTPEQRHIWLLNFEDEASAEKAYQDLKQGKSFKDVAVALNQRDYDMGWASETDFNPNIAKSIFTLETSHYSNIIHDENNSGIWQIFYVHDIKPKISRGFEEVRDQIKEEEQYKQARLILQTKADQLDELLGSTKTLKECAEDLQLDYYTYETMTESAFAQDPNLKTLTRLQDILFAQALGEESAIETEANGTHFIVKTTHIIPETAQSFAEVKDQVALDWQKAEQKNAAQNFVDTIEETVSTQSLAEYANAQQRKIKTTPLFNRQAHGLNAENDIPFYIAQNAFLHDKDSVFAAYDQQSNQVYVMQVTSIQKASLPIPAESQEFITLDVKETTKNSLVTAFISSQQEDIGVKLYPERLNRLAK